MVSSDWRVSYVVWPWFCLRTCNTYRTWETHIRFVLGFVFLRRRKSNDIVDFQWAAIDSRDSYHYFQAFKQHKLHDPLEEPGSADLTADVDFSYLQQVAGNQGKCLID